MPHVGIFGTTMCGKSTLARYLIREVYKRRNYPCLVLDPVGDPAYLRAGADLVTSDPSEFMSVVNANPDSILFVDESGDLKGNDSVRRLATQYRHGGFKTHFMGHRYIDVSPPVRTCLQYTFLFRSTKNDCALLADDFTDEALLAGVTLAKGEYIYLEKMGQPRRGTIAPLFGKV